MSDADWNAARLQELWEALAPEVADITDKLERSQAALRVIRDRERDFRAGAEKGGDIASALSALGAARAIWALLTVEMAGWTIHWMDAFVPHMSQTLSGDRSSLRRSLDSVNSSIPPMHRPAVDPVPALLSRAELEALLNALAALDSGEVQPILAPSSGGRHGDSWSWDQMRRRAVAHVHYMKGQGQTLKAARRRVAYALKIGTETLRGWESNEALVCKLRSMAVEAGKLKLVLEDNPNYGSGDGNSIDAEVLHLHEKLKSDSIAEFGREYQARYGSRYHSRPTGVD